MADFSQLGRALLPEATLVIGALVALAVDMFSLRDRDLSRRASVSALLGTVAALLALLANEYTGVLGSVFEGVFVLDVAGVVTRAIVLVLVILTMGIVGGAAPNRNPAEYVAVILLGAVGLLLMPVVQNLLAAFVALELASLSLYVMVGFDKTRPDAAEAALKYFLFGGVSAAFLLFGMSLIYGSAGSMDFLTISRALAERGMTPLLAVALVMVVAAFGFKVAAAPFHLWAPDAYQGAPAPSAALVASASKLAAVLLFYRLLWPALYPAAGSISEIGSLEVGWQLVLLLVATLALLLGNLVALAQRNLRRLLAYSAIAHAGVFLIGVIAAGPFGPSSLIFYGASYGVATAGVFGVVAVLDRASGCQEIEDLAGLWRRSPLLAGCLAVFVLSLAGIPPLAGFLAKFNVFAQSIRYAGMSSPLGWAALLAIGLSAVGLYYYLIVLKAALVAPARAEATRIHVPVSAALTLLVAVGVTVVLGVFPELLLGAFG